MRERWGNRCGFGWALVKENVVNESVGKRVIASNSTATMRGEGPASRKRMKERERKWV